MPLGIPPRTSMVRDGAMPNGIAPYVLTPLTGRQQPLPTLCGPLTPAATGNAGRSAPRIS